MTSKTKQVEEGAVRFTPTPSGGMIETVDRKGKTVSVLCLTREELEAVRSLLSESAGGSDGT